MSASPRGPGPLGGATALAELAGPDPHPHLAALREREPVSWLPELGGWLVTRRDLALEVLRDAATFTVDDPRFTTARVVGPSMLSLEGDAHRRHREPFAGPFRKREVGQRFSATVEAEVARLLEGFGDGAVELRSRFAGPLAAAIVGAALGLERTPPAQMLDWYADIVAAVGEMTAGREPAPAGSNAFAALREAILPVLDRDAASSLLAAAAGAAQGLSAEQVISNAGVLLFGGIETTEGMILNAVAALLAHPEQLALVLAEPALVRAAVEESLRWEPAAAIVDRYATRDVELGGAAIGAGELVAISITAANRDPEAFPDPDRFDVRRDGQAGHAAWGAGPHVCIGMHLARLEAWAAVAALLPRLERAPARAVRSRGLVFRKPAELVLG